MKSTSLFSGLRVRAVMLVLLVAAPFGAVVWQSTASLRQERASAVQQHAANLVRLVAHEQGRYIQGAHLLLTTLSRVPEVQQQGTDPTTCNALLASLLRQFPQYANLGVISPAGQISCRGYVPRGGLSDQAAFLQPLAAQAFAERRFIVGDYQIDAITGKPVLAFAYPVPGNDEEVVSVLFATLDLGWLNEIPPEALLPAGTTLTVVDEHGIVLVHYPESARSIGESIAEEELFRAIVAGAGEGTAVLEGQDGVRRLYAFAPLPGNPEREIGFVSIGLTPEVAFAEVDRIFVGNLILLVVLAVLGIGIAWTGSGWFISGPIGRLREAARRVSGGDLEARVGPALGGGELGELARTFDEMAASLKARQEETERARLQLQISEERFQLVARASGEALWEYERATDSLWWSENFYHLFGRLAEGAVNDLRMWKERIHPEDRERVVAGIQEAIESGEQVWSGEYRFRRANGTYAHVSHSEYIVYDSAGQAVKQVGSIRDVTKRKVAEEALRFRLRQQAVLAEFGQHALMGATLTTLLDEAAHLVSDTLHVEFVKVLEFVPEDDALVMHAGVGWKSGVIGTRHPTGGQESQAGHTLLSPGPVIVEDLRTETRFRPSPILVEHGVISSVSVPIPGRGRPFGVLCAHTAVKRTFTLDDVNFLQAIANVLATVVERERAEEALQYTERQVRQAQKVEAIGRLAGGIAHDFNNLLTVIKGNSDILLQDLPYPDPRRDVVQEISQASRRAARLTQQLLAYSRRQVMQPRVLEINASIGGIREMLRRLIGAHITLEVRLDPALGRVMADAGQIEQVLLNLAVNAQDAMPRGGTLTIETRNVVIDGGPKRDLPGDVAPGEYVELRVSDTGTGMDEQTLTRMFEPFFTTKEVGKGTGLGLSTVYGIVRQSGGYVWAESTPGKGSTFFILLPRVEQLADAAPPGAATPRGPTGTATVLLVEDEQAVRSLTRRILELSGYKVLEALDVVDAERLCREHEGPVHLLLTDVVMPVMNGPELAERLLRIRPEMAVLFTSGYTDEALNDQGMVKPGVHFLEKPFSPAGLLRRVHEVLDMAAAACVRGEG